MPATQTTETMTRQVGEDRVAYLRELPEPGWDLATACEGWTVRHVVSHLIGLSEQTLLRLFRGAIASRGDFDAMVQRGVDERLGESSAMIERLAAAIASPTTPRPMRNIALAEFICHGEDIRRAADIRGAYAADAVAAACATFVDMGGPIQGKARSAGLHLQADDCNFRHGEGPEVTGAGVNLLLALVGRREALEHLRGSGVDTLRSRL